MRRLLHSETNGKTFIYPMSGLLKLRGRVNGTQTKGFVDTEREREREDLIMWLWRPKFPSPAGHGLSSRELYTLLSSLYLDELGRSRRRRRNEREFIKSGGRRSLERERDELVGHVSLITQPISNSARLLQATAGRARVGYMRLVRGGSVGSYHRVFFFSFLSFSFRSPRLCVSPPQSTRPRGFNSPLSLCYMTSADAVYLTFMRLNFELIWWRILGIKEAREKTVGSGWIISCIFPSLK